MVILLIDFILISIVLVNRVRSELAALHDLIWH